MREIVDFFTSHKAMRLAVLVWSLTIMTISYLWGMNYINEIGFSNITLEHSTILGVILGPITVLQGAIVKYYAMFGDD